VIEGSENELCEKYPSAEDVVGARNNLEALREGGGVCRFGVDVSKKGYGVGIGKKERWDRVVFNFPHVGGKTKDVNRQVRYNQGTSSPS
jgi:25S rRNA (uracil2634-N3)-methyltransferase